MAVDSPAKSKEGPNFGVWALVSGILAAFGVFMIGQASWTWIPGWEPANWLRIATIWMFPVGAIAAFILGGISIKRSQGKALGYAGVGLAVVSVAMFGWMIASNPY